MVAPAPPKPRTTGYSAAMRRRHLRTFLTGVEAHQQAGDWPSPFTQVLGLTMRDHGIGPGELARRSGIPYDKIHFWLCGTDVPLDGDVSRLELALELEASTLANHMPVRAARPQAWTPKLTDRQRTILEYSATATGNLARAELVEALDIDQSILSAAIRRLEELGLVELLAFNGERITMGVVPRKVKYITITESGRTTLRLLAEGHIPQVMHQPLPGWCEPFLAALREAPNVSRAARAAGVTRGTPPRARERIPAFAQAWDEAAAIGQASMAPGAYLGTEEHQLAYRRKFAAWCAAMDNADSWPTDYASDFCHALVEKNLYPAAAVRLFLDHHPTRLPNGLKLLVNSWVTGKYVPHHSTAARAERDLYLPPGQLSKHANRAGKAASERGRRLWDKRRRKAGSLAKRRLRVLEGRYNGGFGSVAMMERRSRRRAYEPRSQPMTFQGRIRKTLWRVCNDTAGVFLSCSVCHQPLIRPHDSLRSGSFHAHAECWREYSSRGQHPHTRPSNKPGWPAAEQIRTVFLHDGLGLSLRDLAERLLHGQSTNDLRTITQRVQRGRQTLLGMRWGQLMSLRSSATSIHRLFHGLLVTEVLEIAAGSHPLANERDREAMERWMTADSRQE